MGEVRVPQDALWRAQTQRAVENFPISGTAAGARARSGAGPGQGGGRQVNAELGVITPEQAQAIVTPPTRSSAASTTTRSRSTSSRPARAPLQHEHERGARHARRRAPASTSTPTTTSTPASRATTPSRPRSTSPPTARRRATWSRRSTSSRRRSRPRPTEFDDVVKSGRTHLMDATPVTLGQEFGGYAAIVRLGIERLEATLPRVARAAARRHRGRHRHQHPRRLRRSGHRGARGRRPACRSPRRATTSRRRANRDGLVELAAQLRTIAVGLTKICNDLRWMWLRPDDRPLRDPLPDLQPGSSIMPGKVNPVLPEATLMVCARVIGNDAPSPRPAPAAASSST